MPRASLGRCGEEADVVIRQRSLLRRMGEALLAPIAGLVMLLVLPLYGTVILVYAAFAAVARGARGAGRHLHEVRLR